MSITPPVLALSRAETYGSSTHVPTPPLLSQSKSINIFSGRKCSPELTTRKRANSSPSASPTALVLVDRNGTKAPLTLGVKAQGTDTQGSRAQSSLSVDLSEQESFNCQGALGEALRRSHSCASSSSTGSSDIVFVEVAIAKIPLHIEVRLRSDSSMRFDVLRRMMHIHIDSEYETLLTFSELQDWRENATLAGNIERVWIGECAMLSSVVPLSQVTLLIHIYQLAPSTSISEFSLDDEQTEGEEPQVVAASVLGLPSASLEGVWENLIYEDNIKDKLLGYIYSTILFSDASVDFNIVSWNRVVLLHGPPGTGKTSLCRALAQKLTIRLSDRYEQGRLVEINSHSLFSKWFSESGKLVQKLFSAINEMLEDEGSLIVVLIDEVESLTAARAGAMSGKEPSDALRVVNVLLTQLDKLKHRKNCLIMTTSNLSAAIDVAFIDRADIKQYIGLPPVRAVYWILQSCLKEIMRAGLIAQTELHDWDTVEVHRSLGIHEVDRSKRCSSRLFDLAHDCHGMSGRTLRRLPVLAHAHYIGMTMAKSPSMEVWLEAMRRCVKDQAAQMEKVEAPSMTRGGES